MTHPMRTLILPGFGGSGPDHWQSHFERADPGASRFQPGSWDAPDREDWCRALDVALDAAAEPAMLVAHSLACLLVAHAASRGLLADRVAGAFLVAPPDPNAPAFPRAEAASFTDVPMRGLGVPALVVASSNDPYGSLAFAHGCAVGWRAGFVEIGALGHINADSGLGVWDEGARLLAAFRAGCTLSSPGPGAGSSALRQRGAG